MVPGARIELAHGYPYQILSLARLPVPPPRQRFDSIKVPTTVMLLRARS